MSDERHETVADNVSANHQFREVAKMIPHEEDVSKMETTTPTGNAAAMREALLRCDAIAQLPEIREYIIVKEMRNLIKGALSAPPRNCDLYETPKEAGEAFISQECENPCGNCTVSDECNNPLVHECGIEWLFSEAKGDKK